jgi:hypothetical protein
MYRRYKDSFWHSSHGGWGGIGGNRKEGRYEGVEKTGAKGEGGEGARRPGKMEDVL